MTWPLDCWLLLQPTFRSAGAAGPMHQSTRQAWYAFQTVRRWHENGHAARVAALAAVSMASGRIGTIDRFTFVVESNPGLEGRVLSLFAPGEGRTP